MAYDAHDHLLRRTLQLVVGTDRISDGHHDGSFDPTRLHNMVILFLRYTVEGIL